MKPTERINRATPDQVARWIHAESKVLELLTTVTELWKQTMGMSAEAISRHPIYKGLSKAWDKTSVATDFAIDLQQARNALPSRVDDCMDQLMNIQADIRALIEQHENANKQRPEQT